MEDIQFSTKGFSVIVPSNAATIHNIFTSFEMFLVDIGYTPREIQNEYDERAHEDDWR